MSELRSYPVWDVPTRWFHWINALCVIGLAALGLPGADQRRVW